MAAAEDHVVRLGKVAMNGQLLELTVGIVLSQSLAITPEIGSVVAGRLGLSGALDVIGVVARGPDYPLDAPTVDAWLPLARRAVQARNEAIHTPWVASAEGGELNAVIRKGHKLRTAFGVGPGQDRDVASRGDYGRPSSAQTRRLVGSAQRGTASILKAGHS